MVTYFRYLILLNLICFSTTILHSQSRLIIPMSEAEIEKASIVPGLEIPINQKVMACAGNAPNDNFANAQTLVVNGGNVAGTTCGTFEAGETKACYPAGDNSVWYNFVATATVHYVKIAYTSGGCFFASAIYNSSSTPTTACGNKGPISCQSASGGPLDHLYHLTGLTIGATYYIQVMYNAGGPCGQNATFNIQVTTANPGGTITNKPDIASCASPDPGCFFNSPPTVSTVTSTCNSYSLSGAGYNANSVFTVYQTFTSSASWSNFSWQAIITSNCSGGNVVWLNWALYDCSCNELACGDIGTLTGSGLACGTCYILKYQMELANCSSFTTIWPYQNVPSSPTPCSALPIELLSFMARPTTNAEVNVTWETFAEVNISHFLLERSLDGVNFEKVNNQMSTGSSSSSQKYTYNDIDKKEKGTYYYKLKAVEKNGSIAYDKIIAVAIDGDKQLVRFSPNPAHTNFVIAVGEDALNKETYMFITNSIGQKVKEEKFVTDNFYKEVNIVDLPSGIYFINLYSPAFTDVIKYKLIKQ